MLECIFIIIGAIIAGIFTIMGGFMTYFFGVKIVKRQEFNKAASIFRTTLLKGIRILERPEMDTIEEKILCDILRENEIAILEFSYYLSIEQHKSFDIAWQKYNNKNQDTYDIIRLRVREDKEFPERRKIIVKHIKNLLEFAKPK